MYDAYQALVGESGKSPDGRTFKQFPLWQRIAAVRRAVAEQPTLYGVALRRVRRWERKLA